jgi:starch synthase (maltosyl-transferring)
MSGPIVYNLFPKLAGQMKGWVPHIRRAKDMGFDTVYVNPVHYPGFSGSIYAPKDYYAYDPIIVEPDVPGHDQLHAVIDETRRLGMRFMMDLVINHTSIDCPLITEHPTWFKRKADGTVENPTAIDPADARKVTVWGDLAEVDNEGSPDRAELWDYWKKLVGFYMEMGVADFRCDAAYKVPDALWKELIESARVKDPGARFFAETLGCTLEDVQKIAAAGFDYIFNSIKWWDLREPWLLEQYEATRKLAPSIAFPESHDTPRLAEELKGNEAALRMRYALAAFFSTGVMTVMGYEYGYRKALDVVKTTPFDAETPSLDLGLWIGTVNHVKRQLPIMNVDAEITQVSAKDDPVLILRKKHGAERALIVVNRALDKDHRLDAAKWAEWMDVPAGRVAAVRERTPLIQNDAPIPAGWAIDLKPAELRLLHLPAE